MYNFSVYCLSTSRDNSFLHDVIRGDRSSSAVEHGKNLQRRQMRRLRCTQNFIIITASYNNGKYTSEKHSDHYDL